MRSRWPLIEPSRDSARRAMPRMTASRVADSSSNRRMFSRAMAVWSTSVQQRRMSSCANAPSDRLPKSNTPTGPRRVRIGITSSLRRSGSAMK